MRQWCFASIIFAALIAAGVAAGQEPRRDRDRASAEAARPAEGRPAESEKSALDKGQGERAADAGKRGSPDTPPGGSGSPGTHDSPGARPADRPRGRASSIAPGPPRGDFRRGDAPPLPGAPLDGQEDQPRGGRPFFPGHVGGPSLPPALGPGQIPPAGGPGAGLPAVGGGWPHMMGPLAGRPDENGVGFLQRIDPELHRLYQSDFECERQCQLLAAKIREASREERELLLKELTGLVQKHFQIRQERRRLMLRLLEEELARTREAIEAREAARDELVQRRIHDLTGERPVLDF